MSDAGLLDDIPAALWRHVALAPRRLLMLDYDGTLALLTPHRDRAHPVPESLDLIRSLARSAHTRLAIVSGRPLEELAAKIGPLQATLVGEHGWEWRVPGGEIVRYPLEEAVFEALSEAAQLARDAGLDEHLERKRTAIVMHTRGLAEARAREVRERADALWRRFAGDPRLVLDQFDGGIELRASERNKGTATRALLEEAGPDTLGVFVGDDVTDEDAFAVLNGRGFGIYVGDDRPESRAQGRLSSPAAVSAFLEEWLRLLDGAA
jgi:trehalose-phosphatase